MRTSTASENLPTNTNIHTHTYEHQVVLENLDVVSADCGGVKRNSTKLSCWTEIPNKQSFSQHGRNQESKQHVQKQKATRETNKGRLPWGSARVCACGGGEEKKGGGGVAQGGAGQYEPLNNFILFFFCMFVFASDKTREEGHRGQNIEKPVRVLPSLVTSATSAARKPGRPTVLRATPEVQVL